VTAQLRPAEYTPAERGDAGRKRTSRPFFSKRHFQVLALSGLIKQRPGMSAYRQEADASCGLVPSSRLSAVRKNCFRPLIDQSRQGGPLTDTAQACSALYPKRTSHSASRMSPSDSKADIEDCRFGNPRIQLMERFHLSLPYADCCQTSRTPLLQVVSVQKLSPKRQ